MLADALQTNTTYISVALKQQKHKNFSNLINDYRVNQVKAELADNNHKTFTIEHIYTKAGFTQQSTFNRVFKEFTGKTPSEYIEDSNN